MILFFLACSLIGKEAFAISKHYQFYNEPIDVVIPSTEKDLAILNLCIAGIKKNCQNIRRIIVVSETPLTDQAEWFDEQLYPFNKEKVALYLLKEDIMAARNFLRSSSRVGWYYQQLLKYYALYVIPGISSNVLILDSDTIFLNPIELMDTNFAGLYNPGFEYHQPYFVHANRLLPGLKRIYPKYSGISHHMLFQMSVLQDLFHTVENYHKKPLWQVFCHCVDLNELQGSGASEYEIYFNFVFDRTDQVHLRPLKWANVQDFDNLESYQIQGYHYVSCHAWMR